MKSVEKLRFNRDGVSLTGYVAGSGPVLVLASGLGGPVSAWRHQFAHFAKRYTVLSWDYRGLFESEPLGPGAPVDVATHAADLDRLLETVGAEQAVIVGWSMGVQVALEHHARFPARASHLVLINGTAGRPFESLPVPGTHLFMPHLLRRVERHHRRYDALLKRAVDVPAAVKAIQALSAFATELPRDLTRELLREFARIDVGTYLRTLRALGEHDAFHLLRDVRVPSLLIAGGRDYFTPQRLARRMAREIGNAEIVIAPRGTHYTATEFPDFVNRHIDAFLARNGARTPETPRARWG